MDTRARAAGDVYRDEAAALMAAAARTAPPRQPAPPEPERSPAPRVRPEARRPLPYPDPVGTNDNTGIDPAEPAPRKKRRRLSLARLAARIVVAPVYVAVALGTLGVLALFVVALLNTPAG